MKKLISWNVNGIRACLTHGFEEFFHAEHPDFMCLQEVKADDEQVNLEFDGYHKYWFSSTVKKGYSGTAIFAKEEPKSVKYGMNDLYNDEGRLITLEYEDFYLVCVYVPNSKEELLRLDYRCEFEDHFREYLSDLANKKHVIMCGDLNVAHNEIDLKNPASNTRNPGFTIEERTKFSKLLETGFIDSFRYLYPDTVKYSWWSYRFQSRLKNIGWRIDYFVTSNSLKDKIVDSIIRDDVMGSDHCPIELLINL